MIEKMVIKFPMAYNIPNAINKKGKGPIHVANCNDTTVAIYTPVAIVPMDVNA